MLLICVIGSIHRDRSDNVGAFDMIDRSVLRILDQKGDGMSRLAE
jgi:hypothetical protein